MEKTEKINVPPNWKTAVLLGTTALFFYLVEDYFGPFNSLSYTLNTHYFCILLLLGMLFFLCHYSFSDATIEIKFLGIRLRTIYWFEVSSAILVYRKDHSTNGLVFISIYPCQSVMHPSRNTFLNMLCHPTTIFAIYMTSKYEKCYLKVFQQCCKNFTIQDKSNPNF